MVNPAVVVPTVGTAPTSSVARRTSLVTVDQAVSSASNLLIVLLAAHALTTADFGRFGLVMLIYTFALGPTRSVVSVPIVVHPEDADHRPWDVLGSAALLSLVGGVVCLGAGGLLLLAGSSMAPSVLVLGAVLPLLQLQDVGRYLAIARSQPGRAIVLDGIWLVLMLAAVTLVLVFAEHSLTWFMLAWGGTGGAAALWLFGQYGLPHRGFLSTRWVRERWSFSWRSLVADTTNSGGVLAGAAFVTYVASPVVVAAVRAALLLTRPSSALQTAVATTTATEVARDKLDDDTLRRHQRRTMAISMCIALANLGVLLVIPDWLGRALLGNVWPLVAPLMLAIGLAPVATATQGGIRAALLGRRQIGATMVVDIVGAFASIGAMIIGAVIAGATGAVWSLVVGQALIALCWWVAYGRYLRGLHHSGGRHRRVAGDPAPALLPQPQLADRAI